MKYADAMLRALGFAGSHRKLTGTLQEANRFVATDGISMAFVRFDVDGEPPFPASTVHTGEYEISKRTFPDCGAITEGEWTDVGTMSRSGVAKLTGVSIGWLDGVPGAGMMLFAEGGALYAELPSRCNNHRCPTCGAEPPSGVVVEIGTSQGDGAVCALDPQIVLRHLSGVEGDDDFVVSRKVDAFVPAGETPMKFTTTAEDHIIMPMKGTKVKS